MMAKYRQYCQYCGAPLDDGDELEICQYCEAPFDEVDEFENCQYCGTPLVEGCECLRELAEYEANIIEELENSLETQFGYRQQDLIDYHRFER